MASERVRCWKCKEMVRLTSAYFIHPVTRQKLVHPYCEHCYGRAVRASVSNPSWSELRKVLDPDEVESVMELSLRREMDKSSEG